MKKWSWLIRLFVFLLILVGVAYQFSRILSSEALNQPGGAESATGILLEVSQKVPALCWFLSGLLYALGILNSWWLWHWLARRMGDRMHLLGSAFAITYSQLGKYAPGKGLAMMIRVAWASQAGARIPVAAVSAVYEVLTTMASGALIGLTLGLFFFWQDGTGRGLTEIPAVLYHAAGMFLLAFIPVTPPVFNRLVVRLAGRFMKPGQEIAKPGWRELGVGLLLASVNWALLGTALFVLTLDLDQKLPLSGPAGWFHCVQYASLANVGGFIASTPGGMGVREFLLQQYLDPHLGADSVVLVLLIRLVWTLAEIGLLAIVWIAGRLAVKRTVDSLQSPNRAQSPEALQQGKPD